MQAQADAQKAEFEALARSRAIVAEGEAAAAPADNAWLAELKQLAELKRDGILSDEEFAAAKKKLLGL